MSDLANQPGKLPVFKGYTVDYRLREFRKMIPGKKLEFIPFNSPKGVRLLNAFEYSDLFSTNAPFQD